MYGPCEIAGVVTLGAWDIGFAVFGVICMGVGGLMKMGDAGLFAPVFWALVIALGALLWHRGDWARALLVPVRFFRFVGKLNLYVGLPFLLLRLAFSF